MGYPDYYAILTLGWCQRWQLSDKILDPFLSLLYPGKLTNPLPPSLAANADTFPMGTTRNGAQVPGEKQGYIALRSELERKC